MVDRQDTRAVIDSPSPTGYLLVVTKEPLQQDPPSSETMDILKEIVQKEGHGGGHISTIEIDEEGLVVRVI